MKLIKIHDYEPVIDYLSLKISGQINQNKRVFWLVAGGSALDIAVKAAQRLSAAENTNLITVCLTDERYGPVGHPDSNWRQLQVKGFGLAGAKMIPVLDGRDIEQTAARYEQTLAKQLAAGDYSIALAGMGADGHIFGIKPNSPSINSRHDVISYAWDDYLRLTPTPYFIKKLDEIVIYAAGREKHAQFDQLKKDILLTDQPAQLLKQLRRVTIFNDYIEGEI